MDACARGGARGAGPPRQPAGGVRLTRVARIGGRAAAGRIPGRAGARRRSVVPGADRGGVRARARRPRLVASASGGRVPRHRGARTDHAPERRDEEDREKVERWGWRTIGGERKGGGVRGGGG